MVCAQMEEACAYGVARHAAVDDTQELLGREGLLLGASMLREVGLNPIVINLEAS